MRLELADRVIDRVFEFFERAVEGKLPRIGQMTDCNRLKVRHTGFDHASFVRVAVFARIFIRDVHFNASDAIAEAIERIADDVGEPLFDVGSKVDVITVIHLDVHVVLVMFLVLDLKHEPSVRAPPTQPKGCANGSCSPEPGRDG
jgi:hypothetical protein